MMINSNQLKKDKEILRKIKADRFSKGAKKRVAILMRVSTRKQSDTDEKIPIPVQREQLLEMINNNPDWTLATQNGEIIEYVEVNSAYKISRTERKMLNKALEDAENDLFDIIIFFKHDRLSRISDEYTTILNDFWQLGVEPWDFEKKQPLVMKTQMDKLVRYIEGWQGETESSNTAFRVTQNMRSYAGQGKWMGGNLPYGYNYKDPSIIEGTDTKGKNRKKIHSGIEINLAESNFVKLVFKLYNNGNGSSRICKIVNNPPYSYRKRNGKPFDHTSILNIIKNPIYTGIITWGKTSYKDTYFQRIPEEEWVKSHVMEEYRIIEDEVWETSQRLLQERSKQTKKGKKVSSRSMASERLLSGITFCGYCGEPFLSKSYSNPQKNYKREGYICRSKKRKTECEGKRGFWEKNELDLIVFEAIIGTINQFLIIDKEEMLIRINELYNEGKNSNQDHIKLAVEEIKQLKLLQTYYIEQFNKMIAGIKIDLPATIIKEQIEQIQNKLEAANSYYNELLEKQSRQELDIKVIEEIIVFMNHFESISKDADITMKKSMMEQVVDKILIYDNQVFIEFKLDLHNIRGCAFDYTEEYHKLMNI